MTTLFAASSDTLIERRVIPLADLDLDPGLQPRDGLDEETIERYASAMAAGVQLPDIVVYYDGTIYRLADGWHRHAAATRLQRVTISAEIHRGTRQEALLYALRANTEHGLQRRPGDLRRAVELALNNPTIARESDRRIAEMCRCSHTYVSQVRKALSGNSCQIDDEETRIVRRGEQVFEQAVNREARSAARSVEPEPTEADIAVARDLIAEALTTWTRPVNLGSISNQVRRLPGGADTTKKAVKVAIYRMVEAGNVIEQQDAYGRTVYALAHDPAVDQPAPDTPMVIDELNAKFDRSAITILGRTDDGAEHRAVDVARKLVAASLWDGQARIEFDAYALHDRLYGIEQADPASLVAGHDYIIQPARPADPLLFTRILDLLAASPLPAPILCERLDMVSADSRQTVYLVLGELRRDGRVREYRGMWFVEREQPAAEPEPQQTAAEVDAANGFTEASAIPYGEPGPDPFDDYAHYQQYAVPALSVADFLARYYKADRYTGRGEDYAAALLASYEERFEADGFVFISHHDSKTGEIVAYYGMPATPMDVLLDRPVSRGDGDDWERELPPTQTSQDAEKILQILKRHSPMPLRMRFIREQLDMSDSDFYRARMLLESTGEVKQLGESLHLVFKTAPEPATPTEPPPVVIDATQEEPNGNGMDVHYSSKTDEWHTPAGLLERVITALTGIDLDPCSNSHEAPNVPAAMHYTKEDDGLTREWAGKVFLNPPYGRSIPQWIDKLVGEYEAGRVTQAIALVPARTDTAWFAALRDFPRCFLQGRLKFLTPEGAETDPAPFPNVLVYLGDEIDRFAAAFADLGDIYVRYTPKDEGGDLPV